MVMNTYNIVIIGADKAQSQFTLAATSWSAAIAAAKARVGLDVAPEMDDNLLIVQKTGKLDFVAQA